MKNKSAAHLIETDKLNLLSFQHKTMDWVVCL